MRSAVARASVNTATIPAPMGGVNTVAPAGALPRTDCLYAYNLIASELGLLTRMGYQEWCTNLTGPLDNTVRTMLPFNGSAKNGASDKLFATTADGIWDVSASSAAPTRVLEFTTKSGDAGYGVSYVMASAAGRFLLYTDEENGYFVYTDSTGLWTQVAQGVGAGQINGVDPSTFVHCFVWKKRVWFVQRDTTKAWYLDVNSLFGTATAFDFGPEMRAGGPLRCLAGWSYDGGNGLDTLLVGISGAGDVVIYQGTNPSSADTFGIKGTWSVGGVPYGRRIATDYGGDLLILSSLGVIPLSKLVVGGATEDTRQHATAKISNVFTRLVATYGDVPGWAVHIHPRENALVVTVPTAAGQPTTQWAMSFSGRAWFPWRDLPIVSAGAWGRDLYFGTADGRVCKHTGSVDNVLLADPDSYEPVKWSLLTRYDDLQNLNHKQVHLIIPNVLSQTPDSVIESTAKYDYDLVEPAEPTGDPEGDENTWDTGLWDTALWQGDHIATQDIEGATGLGRAVAIAMRGNAISRTTIVSIGVAFETGGLL